MQRLKKLLKQAAAEQQAERPHAAREQEDALGGQAPQQPATPSMTPAEREFVRVLNQDLEKVNTYFMEAEEDAVMKLQALEERLTGALCADDDTLRSAFVDLHGEMVLLLHWSLVNYAGVAKILKKHDKILGSEGRPLHPYLAKVLRQPFTSTEGISRLVKAAEGHVQRLSSTAADATNADCTGVSAEPSPQEAALVK